MEPILTRCGYRCDLCLLYKPNVDLNPTDFQKLSERFYKYFGFHLSSPPVLCDGCLSEKARLVDTGCPVRPCVIEKGLDNCSQCEQYICDKLKQRLVVYEEVKERVGFDIPQDDYVFVIRPYENKLRLDALRK